MPNDSLNTLGGFTPVIDAFGKITGYTTTKGGADTVFPFSSEISETYVVDPTTYARFDSNNSAGTRSWSKPSSEYNYCIWTMLNQNYADKVVINSVTGASVISELNCYVNVDAPSRANTLFLKVDSDTFSVNYKPFQKHQIGLIWIK